MHRWSKEVMEEMDRRGREPPRGLFAEGELGAPAA
jgi:hypothetical protein